MKKYIKIILMVIILICISQVIKFTIPKEERVIVPGLLKITYTKNTGGAFSIGSSNLVQIVLLNLLVIIFVIRLFIMHFEKINKITKITLCLIIAGGTSNLIDRIFMGFVIDYIDINEFIKFPIFNVADIFIVIGWIIFVINTVRYSIKAKK